MNFTLAKTTEILERTPTVLRALVAGLHSDWTTNNEGGETWTVYDVVGHLIHCEHAGWRTRAELLLTGPTDEAWKPFDRTAHFAESRGKSLDELLTQFARLRSTNLEQLRARNLTVEELRTEGNHPAFGRVTLSQLLATWAAHDLNHLAQIARIMAHQYMADVGPWKAYLGIMNVRRTNDREGTE